MKVKVKNKILENSCSFKLFTKLKMRKVKLWGKNWNIYKLIISKEHKRNIVHGFEGKKASAQVHIDYSACSGFTDTGNYLKERKSKIKTQIN